MKDQVLIDLVKEEAAKLREALTVEEAFNLDFETLEPDRPKLCIYGQATGDCYSERAAFLIRKCASRIYKGSPDEAVLNGKPTKKNTTAVKIYWGNHKKRTHHSPIEVFIYQPNNKRNNKKLIKYLRRETETLDIC